jgi:hypothetical protein
MTNYHLTPPTTFPSLTVQEKKAARRKVIEAARKLERDSYKAMMQRKRQLQRTYALDTIA